MTRRSRVWGANQGPAPIALGFSSPTTTNSASKSDPRNARTHAKGQIEQIVASIRGFGFSNPILIDPAGVVIAGHGRLRAAKAMGLADVPTIAPVGLTEAQARALRLADNKIALGARWDLDLLRSSSPHSRP
ncbi:ParB/Srx family N-terminal domain-containing protein [Microvirga antarctica]|uniref:ParB/Srx family N-terminal domain-containing protein n=1 Tax=Microvirga antarctica TaxID=2819233 RepID=UPI001FE6473E|nr:ParB/Srx family N-terminal domain-containing protein [Microvirga antarctica]